MSYLEELLPEFRKGAKIRRNSWDNKSYIHLRGSTCCDEDGCTYGLNVSLIADDWEFYQEPTDWDYIIKNKCLCWFWDDETSHLKDFGILESVLDYDCKLYIANNGKNYDNCRPVRRDEVTFYEDRKDE